MKQLRTSLYTVYVFAKMNSLRFFRDRLAIFFTIVFPLIFLVIFGGLFQGGEASFRVALINDADTTFATKFVDQAKDTKLLKIDKDINSFEAAKEKMRRSQIDAAIVLPAEFGIVQPGQAYPSGKALVYYNENNAQAAQTLTAALKAQFQGLNATFVPQVTPFTAEAHSTKESSLTQFDYTFAGLLGFAILSLGIFGPVNVFPELKKQGVLRRYHTTPLRVWQYFVANVISQGLIGLLSIGTMFIVALSFFDLQMRGSYLDFVIVALLGIWTLFGIGLAVGGWASNERQAAPLANLITFPMMFLSGTFFPRFLMPEWLQSASSILPLTPIVDGLRMVITEGRSLIDIAPQLGLIAAWAVIVYAIAFRVFRWE